MTHTNIGPTIGGDAGKPFDYIFPSGAVIKEIQIFSDDNYIQAIQLVYINGQVHKIGNYGAKCQQFILEDGEYLTAISGFNEQFVKNIRFHTNKRMSDSYGGGEAYCYYRFKASEDDKVIGFFGRAGESIEAVGIIIQTSSTASVPKSETVKEPTEVDSTNSESTTSELPEVVAVSSQEEIVPTIQEPVAQEEIVSTQEPVAQEQTVVPTQETPKPKDLQKVEGIGPKIAELLIENGILDLHDLANTTAEKIKEVLKTAGRRYALADPTTWPEQAGLGAKGDWEAMKTLKEKLKKGRRT